jgi:hypothetical protein
MSHASQDGSRHFQQRMSNVANGTTGILRKRRQAPGSLGPREEDYQAQRPGTATWAVECCFRLIRWRSRFRRGSRFRLHFRQPC